MDELQCSRARSPGDGDGDGVGVGVGVKAEVGMASSRAPASSFGPIKSIGAAGAVAYLQPATTSVWPDLSSKNAVVHSVPDAQVAVRNPYFGRLRIFLQLRLLLVLLLGPVICPGICVRAVSLRGGGVMEGDNRITERDHLTEVTTVTAATNGDSHMVLTTKGILNPFDRVGVPPPRLGVIPTERGLSERLLKDPFPAGTDGAFSDGRHPRVALSSVAWLTLAMALASGLGAVPFFFLKLSPSWTGICNGIACGVMLAASFDLITEGQALGGGDCVVIGILAGGVFILVSQKLLSGFGEVTIVDLHGADAKKMVIVVAIMTLHAFGEGAGVGVSFAGPKGLPQGVMVTIAIGIHNIPEGLAVAMILVSKGISPWKALGWSIVSSLPQPLVAVPAFACAETFNRFLPLCLGFAAGCMIWMVFGAVMPDGVKDASPTAVATAATLSVAVMESIDCLMSEAEKDKAEPFRVPPVLSSILFILGPIFGAFGLVIVRRIVRNSLPFLMGMTAAILLVLAGLRPLQLYSSGRMGPVRLSLLFLLGMGVLPSVLRLFSSKHMAKVVGWRINRGREGGALSKKGPCLDLGPGVLQTRKGGLPSFSLHPSAVCMVMVAALAVYAFEDGLASGRGLPNGDGALVGGWHCLPYVILATSLQSMTYGMAAAMSAAVAATGSRRATLVAVLSIGMAGSMGVVAAMTRGETSTSTAQGLDAWQVVAGGVLACAVTAWFPTRNLIIAAPRTCMGIILGLAVIAVSLTSSHIVWLWIPRCSATAAAATTIT